VRLELPYLTCADCAAQLVSHIYAASASGGPLADAALLLCVHCAASRAPETVVAVTPDAVDLLDDVASLHPLGSLDLMVRLGATVVYP
jgi:hypothetical protein